MPNITSFIRYEIDPLQRGAYRTRLKADPEARANFEFAQAQRFILGEERTFCEDKCGRELLNQQQT